MTETQETSPAQHDFTGDGAERTSLAARSRKRGRWAAPAVAAACVVALCGAAVGVQALRVSPASPGDDLSDRWSAVGVPWVDDAAVHFGGREAPRPADLLSVAATADAAFIAGSEHGEMTALSMLGPEGGLRVLDTGLSGIPIADPAGHWAAWTSTSPDGSTVVRAFDASRGVTAEAPVPTEFRVYWVDGESVFLSNGNDKHVVWEPTDPGGVLKPLGLDTADEGLMTDRTSRASVQVARGGTVLKGIGGATIETFSGVRFGTFSPDGAHVALTGRGELTVWNVGSATEEVLPLPDPRRVSSVRWSATGELVVRTTPLAGSDVPDPEAGVRYYTCSPEDRSCDELPSLGLNADEADGLESSAAGQFADFLG